MPDPVVVVGAGMAGLMAARALTAQGVAVTLLDEGAEVGGRLATARLDGCLLDYGAQFFTVRQEPFAAQVQQWLDAGIVEEWCRGFNRPDGHPRYRARQGMAALARHLATGLHLELEAQVVAVRLDGRSWLVETASGALFPAAALVLTPPVPRSLHLLQAGGIPLPPAVRQALQEMDYDPCFALLLALDRPSAVPQPGAVQILGEPLTWVADNQQKGISPGPSLTIHAGPAFTWAHYHDEAAQVTELLLQAAGEWLGGAAVQAWHLARWRYSLPALLYPARCLLAHGSPPLLLAGDGFYEARVEGAALSGLAAAAALLPALKAH